MGVERGLRVLSLCDGMATGRLVLDKLGLNVDTYYASEIDKYAVKVATNNYPDIVEIGDIKKVMYMNEKLCTEKGIFDIGKVDLLLSGVPCTSFSIAGKKENFEGESGELFYEFLRILQEVKPTYFLFENVKMRKDVADEIDKALGVNRVFLNSVDFNGHIRKRYYWTNIPIGEYEKKDIYIKDIIDSSIPYDRPCDELLDRTVYEPSKSSDGVITINPRNKNGKQTWQRGRIYDIEGKCPTICASLFDLNITKDHKTYRKLTIEECEKLQGVPIGYTNGVPKTERGKMLGNGWQVDTVSFILQGIKVL